MMHNTPKYTRELKSNMAKDKTRVLYGTEKKYHSSGHFVSKKESGLDGKNSTEGVNSLK